MFKKFYYLIAFIVIVAIATFHFGLSSVKNSYGDIPFFIKANCINLI